MSNRWRFIIAYFTTDIYGILANKSDMWFAIAALVAGVFFIISAIESKSENKTT